MAASLVSKVASARSRSTLVLEQFLPKLTKKGTRPRATQQTRFHVILKGQQLLRLQRTRKELKNISAKLIRFHFLGICY
jgi:hypothetical protein